MDVLISALKLLQPELDGWHSHEDMKYWLLSFDLNLRCNLKNTSPELGSISHSVFFHRSLQSQGRKSEIKSTSKIPAQLIESFQQEF